MSLQAKVWVERLFSRLNNLYQQLRKKVNIFCQLIIDKISILYQRLIGRDPLLLSQIERLQQKRHIYWELLRWSRNKRQQQMMEITQLQKELLLAQSKIEQVQVEARRVKTEVVKLQTQIAEMESSFEVFRDELIKCLIVTDNHIKRREAIDSFLTFLEETALTDEDKRLIKEGKFQRRQEKRGTRMKALRQFLTGLKEKFSPPKPTTNASS